MFDLKGQIKWNAWKDKSGMSSEDAYVALVDELLGKHKHS
ncbi:acyl-CoA-binding protein [Flavobacteriales bacterium]|nr:acyl-CoA-binding protein [Flavobacteriales bacterium]MDC0304058.1 acyl-CoA-binding protein [Flavobacteriales bacterium]